MRNGIEIDLHGASLPRFRQKLDIREAAADDQKRVAILHHLLRRQRPEQADPAGGVGAVVRYGGLSEKRFHDRRGKLSGSLLQFIR
jgi:hypothetical protein